MLALKYFDDKTSCGVIYCLHICTLFSRNYYSASRLQFLWWKGNFTILNCQAAVAHGRGQGNRAGILADKV